MGTTVDEHSPDMSEVAGARGVGIWPVLLLRGRAQQHDDVDTVDGLDQALRLVSQNG